MQANTSHHKATGKGIRGACNYSWGHVHATDPLFEERIREAVDRDLKRRDGSRSRRGGDVTLTTVAIKRNHKEYNTFYDGLGPGWG